MNTSCSSCTSNKTENNGLYNLTDSTDPTIKGIQITGSQLVINYSGGSSPSPGPPAPAPGPSGSGTCIGPPSGSPPDSWCATNCAGGPCIESTCNLPCIWKPGDPCTSKPCLHGGKCNSSIDKKSFTCTCAKCYKGDTCETINCGGGSECTTGMEGCVADTSTCKCSCDSNCYTADAATKSCKIKDCGECTGGVCVCQNGQLTCNKNPPLDKYLVGYYCPSCPSSSNLTKSDLFSTKYNVIPMAFINFDNTGTLNLVPDPTNCWGGEGGQPNTFNNVCPTKALITELKNKGTKVIGSVGGGAGGIMNIADISTTYISNFVSSALKIIQDYSLDGIDFDIEHRTSSTSADLEIIGLTAREIARQIKSHGYVVAAAPQCSNIGLCTGSAIPAGLASGNNGLTSMFGSPSKSVTSHGISFDKDLLAPNPFWIVFPQMYNAWAQVETPESISAYWTKMTTTGFVQNGTLADYTVKFDTTNFIVGFPSASTAAGSGYIDPDNIINSILKTNSDLRGVMTWDIGADFTHGWNFNNKIGNYLFPS
jgi:chitinase